MRITRKNIESALESLRELLGLPECQLEYCSVYKGYKVSFKSKIHGLDMYPFGQTRLTATEMYYGLKIAYEASRLAKCELKLQ